MNSRLRRVLATATLALLAITPPLLACLWDSDTLRTESKGLPGLVEILTGRFERPPPLYYEMRLERVAAAIEKGSTDLGAYDDAAVACDRLGRGDEAAAWMERKKARLDQLEPAAAETSEHLYRYHANLGTILAHRWLRAGADRSVMADMLAGREHIARAIEINPDAHFGRERYQLLAMDWIIAPPERVSESDGMIHLFWSVEGMQRGTGRGALARAGMSDAVAGLSGLIVLGDAWQSLDVHWALTLALLSEEHGAMASLARQRVLELIDGGRVSLHPDNPSDAVGPRQMADGVEDISLQAERIAAFFRDARAEADAWRQERERFMLAQLNAGKHPDTHSDFWNGYRDSKPPRPPHALFGSTRADQIAPMIAGAALSLAAGIVGLRYLRRLIRRRHRTAAA